MSFWQVFAITLTLLGCLVGGFLARTMGFGSVGILGSAVAGLAGVFVGISVLTYICGMFAMRSIKKSRHP